MLYGMADCELHVFVETAGKNVQRLYWVQFEGYLPSRPELHHTYNSPKHATLGGMDFYVDTWIRRTDEKSEAGSDVEHILRLVEADGYRMPDAMIYVRLVHLLDEQKRKELMIIYAEDLASSGVSPSEMSEGGSAHDKWPSIADGVLHRAEKLITITALR